jgi:hypothetical protein
MSFARGFVISIVAVLAFLSAGCSGEPPDREMQQAQRAIDAARTVGADRYAREEFAAAEDALKRAHEAVDQRDYRLALNHALDSRDRAQEAAKMADAGKAAARTNADHAVTIASTAVTTVQAALKTAEAARQSPRVLAVVRQAIKDGDVHLQEARASFEKGDYEGATRAANGVTQTMSAAEREVDAINAPAARRRR